MARLRFNKDQVLELVDGLADDVEVKLVYDQGVYLMIFDKNKEVVFAKGYNPDINDDWYEKKHRSVGGDDGCDIVGLVESYKEIVSDVTIDVTPTSLKVNLETKADDQVTPEDIVKWCRTKTVISLTDEITFDRKLFRVWNRKYTPELEQQIREQMKGKGSILFYNTLG